MMYRDYLACLVCVLLGSNCQAQNAFGQPIATTVQLPTFGVAFDADGVLQMQIVADPTGALMRERLATAKAALPQDIAKQSKSRKVSLVRLEAELKRLSAAGQPPTEAMLKLAGLNQVRAAYCFPKHGDIVLEGPAEGWTQDLTGRTIGAQTGRPTLLLEDCVVALRAYAPRRAKMDFVGCTISPRQDALAELQKFTRTIPSVVSVSQRQQVAQAVAVGIKRSLGMADVKVFGIPSTTHFASVMIEADYRMKRMAVGVEPPPIPITTFASALTSGRIGGLQRWWFTPSYDGVQTTPDRMGVRLEGQGVQLQTEDKVVLSTGQVVDSGRKPSKAMLTYARSFTNNYEKIAAADPVYAQLRQLCDWLIFAAFMRQQAWFDQVHWNASTLMDEKRFAVNTFASPREAPIVVNTFWKGHRMFAPAGGGVSIEARFALQKMQENTEFAKARDKLRHDNAARSWWWD